MITYKELLEEGKALLLSSEIEEAMLDAWLLLEYAAGIDRTWYYAHMTETVSIEAEGKYRELLGKRAKHIPLQHLTHQAWFMGYEFYVDENVLIPRQDTEVLAEEAIARLKGQKSPGILDMCTGSGCLLLSILKEIPGACGVGADISGEALNVASQNAKRLKIEDRTELVHSDLFCADYFSQNSGRDRREYDMIISNPPYIRTDEIQNLMEEVRLHDPLSALDGGADGLIFYRRLCRDAKNFLKTGAWLLFEIGCDQADAVSKLMEENGYQHIFIKKDLAGLDRVVGGQYRQQEEPDV